ncbi:hypothetical protein ZHAS_00015388 [Anopheles sinensis]|uniref:Uncharacterized protein n=1 Tax=Anopheles sinensis TaxID=74873 RepID=A0A084WB48_ANOSI|nr:hypothetical protein ZHAS_00015388 [Anopheles sinensis]
MNFYSSLKSVEHEARDLWLLRFPQYPPEKDDTAIATPSRNRCAPPPPRERVGRGGGAQNPETERKPSRPTLVTERVQVARKTEHATTKKGFNLSPVSKHGLSSSLLESTQMSERFRVSLYSRFRDESVV